MTVWKTSLLDPPWEERGSGKIKRGAQKHYALLKTKDMPGVILGSGLWTPDENAHVYMFVTNTFLPDGLWLLKELGARYITNLAWTKKRPGIGRYFRGKHELLLFATIGRGWAVRTAPNNIESTIDTAEEDGEDYFPDGDSVEAEHEMENGKRKHSAKPRLFYDLIESRSQGPYAEFFARSLRPGWQTFGDDVALTAPSSIVVATQAALARQREEAGLPSEPPPKKTRARKAPKDVMPIAEMDGADIMLNASREPGEAECPGCGQRVLCEGPETFCACGNKFTRMPSAAERLAAPRDREHEEHAKQLGTKPIPVGSGILEVLDALGVPHREAPRQMFKIEVSDAPLPPPKVSFIEQLEAAFAIPADPGCSFDLLEPSRHELIVQRQQREIDEKRGTRPATCQHGDLRSACILCRARR